MHEDVACPFRHEIREIDGEERATCALLQKLLLEDLEDREQVCEVKRDACVVCSHSLPVVGDLVGTPFASILSNACDRKFAKESTDSFEPLRATKIGQAAEEAVLETQAESILPSCDVLIWCNRVGQYSRRAIESVLNQHRAEIHLHLVVPFEDQQSVGGTFYELLDAYESHYNVSVHFLPDANSPLGALHLLAPCLRSEFAAIQCNDSVSFPNRIHAAITELRRQGSDFIGSPVHSPSGQIESDAKGFACAATSIPWPTLVLRRASFIDIGGISDSTTNVAAELLARARASGAEVSCLPWATVELFGECKESVELNSQGVQPNFESCNLDSIRYPKSVISCDVVLPIFGQLEFARAAIESVIDQEDAETIVHLVDDCGPDDVTELFRYWGSHPQVRLYRNTRNIGQYTSFNNVSEYFETDLVVVQDGDDISLPHRVSTSGNLLKLSGADYFAAAMEQFGTSDAMPVRRSGYPSRKNSPYFAMNPTACFKVDMFRSLGGYADFGAHERNRGGLDTEFMNRAYWSQRRFAISNSIVTRRRVHPEAATRRADTGFGSNLRNQAIRETHRRIAFMRTQAFDPRYFGGLGKYQQLTQRIT